jgi:opacity protein-like surface antigen
MLVEKQTKAQPMKSLKLLTTTTFLAAALMARADGWERNPLQGFYANANVGVNIMPTIHYTEGGRLSTQIGERAGASAGYMVPIAKNTGVGLEFELAETLNGLDNNGFGDSLRGYYYQFPFLVNGVIVCRAVPKWAFYAGAGGGGVYSELHVREVNGFDADFNDHETDGAFQAMGGISYEVIKNGDVGIAYKYLSVFAQHADHIDSHAVVATFTWHL